MIETIIGLCCLLKFIATGFIIVVVLGGAYIWFSMFKNKSGEQFVNASNKNVEDDDETMYDFIKEHVNKFYVNHIPVDSIQELPGTCKNNTSYA